MYNEKMGIAPAQSCTATNRGIGERLMDIEDKLGSCLAVTDDISRKLYSEEFTNPLEASKDARFSVDAALVSIEYRVEMLRNALQTINNRL